jgi:hypothetical protein
MASDGKRQSVMARGSECTTAPQHWIDQGLQLAVTQDTRDKDIRVGV